MLFVIMQIKFVRYCFIRSRIRFRSKRNRHKSIYNKSITRLPTLIAQLNVGNNSIDLINEIRQTLYVLYRNNVITKHVYNGLIEYCTSLIKDITL